mgnify:FL=1
MVKLDTRAPKHLTVGGFKLLFICRGCLVGTTPARLYIYSVNITRANGQPLSALSLSLHGARKGSQYQSKSIDKAVVTVDRLGGAGLALTSSLAAVPVVGLVTIALGGAVLSADTEADAREQGSGAMLLVHGSVSSMAWSISAAAKGSLGVDLGSAGPVNETGRDGTASSVAEVQHGASEAGAVGWVELRLPRRPLWAVAPEGRELLGGGVVGSEGPALCAAVERARRPAWTQSAPPSASTTIASSTAPTVSRGPSGQSSSVTYPRM